MNSSTEGKEEKAQNRTLSFKVKKRKTKWYPKYSYEDQECVPRGGEGFQEEEVADSTRLPRIQGA